MSGSCKFLLGYFRAFLNLAFGWVRYILFSGWNSRLSENIIIEGTRKDLMCPLFINHSKSIMKEIPSKGYFVLKSKRHYAEIPMATGWPLIGTTLDLIAAGSTPNLHKYIDKRHQQFGHIFRERLGSQESVFVSSANLMRSVFLYEGQYPTHPLPESWVLYNKLHECKRGLFFMDGPEWHTNRKIMNRLFLNGNFDWMRLHIDYCTGKLIENWKTATKRNNSCFKIKNLEGQLYRWAIDVVCAVMFGYTAKNTTERLTKALDEFSKNVHKIFENSAHLMSFPPKLARLFRMKIWVQFEKDVTAVLKMGNEIIEMHINQDDQEDDDSLFFKMRLAGVSMDVIKRIFVDLIIAAGDTTAFSSQWALYVLSKHQDIQKEIRSENLKEISESQIVRGLIKETLRLYPVAPFIGRFLALDANIGGYEIKKDTMIILSLYTAGRDSEHFPDPLEVKPDRWYRNSNGHLKNVLQAHGTLPFGIGSRSCIGRKIAMYQMQSLISEMAHNFEITCLNKETIDIVLRLVAVPDHSLELGLKLIEN